MEKIKKGYNLKLISLFVIGTFLFSGNVDAICLSTKTCLRVPLIVSNKKGVERLLENGLPAILEIDDTQAILQLRAEIERRKKQIEERHEKAVKELDGLSIARENTDLFDFAVKSIMGPVTKGIVLLCYGSVARKEMVSYSDTDFILLFKDPKIAEKYREKIEEKIKTALELIGLGRHEVVFHPWDTVRDCLEKGHLSIVDIDKIEGARLIWGDEGLFREAKQQSQLKASQSLDVLIQRFLISELLFGKLSEQYNENESDLKFSKGYLRDILDKIYRWSIYIGIGLTHVTIEEGLELLQQQDVIKEEETRDVLEAEKFFLLVRNEIHLFKNAEVDVLDKESQPEIARRLKMTKEELMNRLKMCANNIERISEKISGKILTYYTNKKDEEWKNKLDNIMTNMAQFDVLTQKSFTEDKESSIRLVAAWYTNEEEVLAHAWKVMLNKGLSEFSILEWSILAAIVNNPHTSPYTLAEIWKRIHDKGAEWRYIVRYIEKHHNFHLPSISGELPVLKESLQENL